MKQRLCIAGGSGLLAVNWALRMGDRYDIILLLNQRIVTIKNFESHVVRLDTKEEALEVVSEIQPDILVNTIAITNVDQCETDFDLAKHVNAGIAQNLAHACASVGCRMVHISTDHLFDGDEPWMTEAATPLPINAYAKTKLEAENLVLDALDEALILRTNFFGWGPGYRRSFSDWIIDNISEGKAIPLYTDAFFTPIYVGNLIDIAHRLLASDLAGIYNAVGNARLSKYDFAMRLCREFDLDANLIQPSSIKQPGAIATRPSDMSLSNLKLHQSLGGMTLGINEMIAQLHLDRHIESQLMSVS